MTKYLRKTAAQANDYLNKSVADKCLKINNAKLCLYTRQTNTTVLLFLMKP